MMLSQIVESYRKEHGISQRELARKLNVSNSYIWQIENNENSATGKPITPSMPFLNDLSKCMGLTLDELISKADDLDAEFSGTSKAAVIEWVKNQATREELLEVGSAIFSELEKRQ